MKEHKNRSKRRIQKNYFSYINVTVWVFVLLGKLGAWQTRFRVENVGISQWSQQQKVMQAENEGPGVDRVSKQFSGLLTQSFHPTSSRLNRELSFEFKLIQKSGLKFEKKYRLKASILLNRFKISKGLHNFSFDDSEKAQFLVTLHEDKNNSTSKAEPTIPVKLLKIKKLQIQAKIDDQFEKKGGIKITKFLFLVVRSASLSEPLERNFGLKIDFSKMKNVKRIHPNSILRQIAVPEDFTAFFLYLWRSAPFITHFYFLVIFVSNTGSRLLQTQFKSFFQLYMDKFFDLGFSLHLLFIFFNYIYAFIFYFISTIQEKHSEFLQPSFYLKQIKLFIHGLLVQKLMIYCAFYIGERYLTRGLRRLGRPILFGPLFLMWIENIIEVTGERSSQIYGQFKDEKRLKIAVFLGVVMSPLIIFCSFAQDWLAYHNWIASLSAIFCSYTMKYRNPCLKDYFWWILYYSYYSLLFEVHLSYSRALVYTSYFYEPFLTSWMYCLTLHSSSLIKSIMVMIATVFINFFLLKSDLYAFFWPRKIPVLDPALKIFAKNAKNQLGAFHILNVKYYEQLEETPGCHLNLTPKIRKRQTFFVVEEGFSRVNGAFEEKKYFFFDPLANLGSPFSIYQSSYERFSRVMIEDISYKGKKRDRAIAILSQKFHLAKRSMSIVLVDLRNKKFCLSLNRQIRDTRFWDRFPRFLSSQQKRLNVVKGNRVVLLSVDRHQRKEKIVLRVVDFGEKEDSDVR